MQRLHRWVPSLLALCVATSACKGCKKKDDPDEDEPNPTLDSLVVETCDNGADDNEDGLLDCQDPRCQMEEACLFEPPDPADVAPPVDPTDLRNFSDSVRFLWEGENAVVRGLDPDALNVDRVAVLRARVLDREGNPVAGIRANVAGQPGLGYTFSRADGAIDLVANGDSPATVRVQAAGYLAVDRTVEAPALDYHTIEDVVLTPVDEKVSEIDDGGLGVGSTISDSDGERTARLWFPKGTVATVHLPDGQKGDISHFNIRLTEYTVGETGPQAMPAILPDQSAYTYAVELSMDEAEALGTEEVTFDRTGYLYLDNFLDFPVGQAVPSGFYSRARNKWEATPDGRVVALVDGGIDVDGSGEPADAAALAELGITAPELAQMGRIFEEGVPFWRTPIVHFSPYDLNWPFDLPEDAVSPDEIVDPRPVPDKDPCAEVGSIIECQNQVLMKSIPLPGTEHRLFYRSDRVRGHMRAFELPVTGDTYPASLKKVLVEVRVAGRIFQEEFEPAPNLTYSFEWDHKDAYGREVFGTAPIQIWTAFVYEAEYTQPAVSTSGSFGQSGSSPVRPARRELPVWRRYRGTFGAFDAKATLGMGGWALDVQPAYDSHEQVLYPPRSPERRGSRDVSHIIRNGETFEGETGLSIDLTDQVVSTAHVMAGLDGAVFVGFQPQGYGTAVLLKRNENGRVELAAGKPLTQEEYRASECLLEENCNEGLATEAHLPGLTWAIGFDDAVYITNGSCVRRIADGEVEKVAGLSCIEGETPPGQENFPHIQHLAVGPDREIYAASSTRIYRLYEGSKRLEVIAGCNNCDGTLDDAASAPALGVELSIEELMAGPGGELYFWDMNDRLVRLQGGQLEVLDFREDQDVRGATLGPDGAVYYFAVDADEPALRLKRFRDGNVTTIGGAAPSELPNDPAALNEAFKADGIPAANAFLLPLGKPAVATTGSLFFAAAADANDDGDVSLVLKEITGVAPPGMSVTEQLLPSRSGRHLLRFAAKGHLQETLSTFNGLTLHSLTYSQNLLEKVTNRNGLETTIERDSRDHLRAVVGPYGHRTEFGLDANGYIAQISYPDGSTREAEYDEHGLLTTWRDGNSAESHYDYDVTGLLTRADDPEGGWKTLTRTGNGVVLETATGRKVEYFTDYDAGTRTSFLTDPAGLVWQTRHLAGGGRELLEPDGTLKTTKLAGDPRFGLQSPLVAERTTQTPGGLEQRSVRSRDVVLSDPDDPTSLESLTDTLEINGVATTYTYDANTNTITRTSPAGRTKTYSFDDKNRLTSVAIGDWEPFVVNYDGSGRVETYAQGDTTLSFSYGADGLFDTMQDALGRSGRVDRDEYGRIVRMTPPSGNARELSYDANGNGAAVTPQAGTTYSQSYNRYQLPVAFEFPSGDVDLTEWDADRRFSSLQRSNGTAVTVDRDEFRRVTGWSTDRGSVSRTYDSVTGRVTQSTSPDGSEDLSWDGFLITGRDVTFDGRTHSITREHDDNFRLVRRVVAGDAVAHQYDEDALPTVVGEAQLTFDAAAPVVTNLTVGRVETDYVRDSRGRLQQVTHRDGATVLFEASYTYDPMLRIALLNETVQGQPSEFRYDYDLDGQLVGVQRDGAVEAVYGYDARGNRTQLAAGVATYDASDRILTAEGRTYDVDASGFVTGWSDGVRSVTLSYDGYELTSATVDGLNVTYGYDTLGRRIWRRVDGAFDRGWLYDDISRPLGEVDASGQLVSRFVYATSSFTPEYMVRDQKTYRMIADHLGSIRLVVDTSDGSVVQRLDYDPLGRVVSDTNPGFQPFGYGSGLLDSDTGLVRIGRRDYDPFVGRWLSPDPLGFAGNSWNLYAYCNNAGVTLVDPLGEGALIPIALYAMGKIAIYSSPLWGTKLYWNTQQERSNARAREIAERMGLGRLDAENAMRHCVWQCHYTRFGGQTFASAFGSAHENPNIPRKVGGGGETNEPGGSSWDDRVKDEHNNLCGQQNGEEEGDCFDLCADDLVHGRLATDMNTPLMSTPELDYSPEPVMTYLD